MQTAAREWAHTLERDAFVSSGRGSAGAGGPPGLNGEPPQKVSSCPFLGFLPAARSNNILNCLMQPDRSAVGGQRSVPLLINPEDKSDIGVVNECVCVCGGGSDLRKVEEDEEEEEEDEKEATTEISLLQPKIENCFCLCLYQNIFGLALTWQL